MDVEFGQESRRAKSFNLTLGATATPGAAATPDAAATQGAVGTSGTATVELDPSIRAKLVEFRRNLNEFQKAASGAKTHEKATPTPGA